MASMGRSGHRDCRQGANGPRGSSPPALVTFGGLPLSGILAGDSPSLWSGTRTFDRAAPVPIRSALKRTETPPIALGSGRRQASRSLDCICLAGPAEQAFAKSNGPSGVVWFALSPATPRSFNLPTTYSCFPPSWVSPRLPKSVAPEPSPPTPIGF